MGSLLPDNTLLGALDVDRNEYASIAEALMRGTICGRVGSKGIALFVRFAPQLTSKKFRVQGEAGKEWGQVAEALFKRNLCVIPPTVHPGTGTSYEWVGTPLLEIDPLMLPLIGQ